jgi:hypothetical protein
MPYIFFKDADAQWTPVELSGTLLLSETGIVETGANTHEAELVIREFKENGFQNKYVLLQRNGTEQKRFRLNGKLAPGELAVLSDHDEILFGDGRFSFSDQSFAVTGLWKPDVDTPACLICDDPFEAEMQVVTCPRCKRVYHEECWVYNPVCSTYGCEFPTGPDQELWMPEEK